MNKFVFDPPNGLLDKNIFPSNPQSEDAARGQFMQLFNQIKDHMNNGGVLLPVDIEFDFNKKYVKMKNGFVVQWGVVPVNDSNYTAEVKVSFQCPLVSAPEVITCIGSATTSLMVNAKNITTSTFTAQVRAVVPSGGSGIGIGSATVTFIALGRWK